MMNNVSRFQNDYIKRIGVTDVILEQCFGTMFFAPFLVMYFDSNYLVEKITMNELFMVNAYVHTTDAWLRAIKLFPRSYSQRKITKTSRPF